MAGRRAHIGGGEECARFQTAFSLKMPSVWTVTLTRRTHVTEPDPTPPQQPNTLAVTLPSGPRDATQHGPRTEECG